MPPARASSGSSGGEEGRGRAGGGWDARAWEAAPCRRAAAAWAGASLGKRLAALPARAQARAHRRAGCLAVAPSLRRSLPPRSARARRGARGRARPSGAVRVCVGGEEAVGGGAPPGEVSSSSCSRRRSVRDAGPPSPHLEAAHELGLGQRRGAAPPHARQLAAQVLGVGRRRGRALNGGVQSGWERRSAAAAPVPCVLGLVGASTRRNNPTPTRPPVSWTRAARRT
jgi:hypothetical protein